MNFINIEFLYLLLFVLIYIYRYKMDRKAIFLISSFICIVIALSRPVIISSNAKSKILDIEFVIALDVSKSMLSQDVKPNRFDFAKEKIAQLLKNLQGEKIALLGFSNQTYMIIPSSNNYEIISFLTKNIDLKNINKDGTNFLSILKASNEILKHRKNKVILLISDGGDEDNFTDEVNYANKNNISVYSYLIASKQGSVIKYKEELVKNKNQDIVISKLNQNINILSSKTDGLSQEYSLKNNDFKIIIDSIRKKFDSSIEVSSENKIELFYIFIIFSFLFFMLSRFEIKGFR